MTTDGQMTTEGQGSGAIRSPDCQEGKHGACIGDAWDHLKDQPAPCACGCHPWAG